MLTKYKVGQQVRISENLNLDMADDPGVTSEMMSKIGKVFTINSVMQPEGWYSLNNGWSWSDEMLEPVIVTADEAFQSLLNGYLSDAEYEQLIKVIKNN